MMRSEITARIEFHKAAAEKLRAAYIALVDGGVSSYSVGTRSLTKLDLFKILDEIDRHERQAAELETLLMGGKRRKAVGVVMRDW